MYTPRNQIFFFRRMYAIMYQGIDNIRAYITSQYITITLLPWDIDVICFLRSADIYQ